MPTARHDTRPRARRSAPAQGPSTRSTDTPLSGEHAQALQFQQAAGNAATSALLAPEVSSAPGGADVIQRKTRPNRRNRSKKKNKGRKAKAGGTKPAATEPTGAEQPAEPQGWGSWLGGMVSSGMSMFSAESEVSGEGEETVAGGSAEQTTGDFEEEEEQGIGSLFGPPEISITLHEKDFKEEWDGADVEGKSALKYKLADATYEGEASIEVKQGDEVSHTTGKVKMYGGMLTAQITTEEFRGERSSAKVKGELGPGKLMARGELGAFRGYEQKTSGSLSVNLGDTPLVTLSGGVGFSVGEGGKAEGLFNYDNGKITMGTKTSVAFGHGVSWDYKIELDTVAIADGLWGWLSSWGAWLSDVSSSLDEALTDEDGDPIRLM